ncbi:hypothetical protein PILCRDRAFT_319589 [Piloderma croceum F 1598]|uniref:Uncharacterized protein n=1 Tax=Piloderma croceum (strain F 1598) TaxID=765440 RepID=A0A0C3G6D5_PILCF|nr:hypothetical protein PILCRDRAFT_319589 [Piloderma croceum F 1598]
MVETEQEKNAQRKNAAAHAHNKRTKITPYFAKWSRLWSGHVYGGFSAQKLNPRAQGRFPREWRFCLLILPFSGHKLNVTSAVWFTCLLSHSTPTTLRVQSTQIGHDSPLLRFRRTHSSYHSGSQWGPTLLRYELRTTE